jgi:hypothetical protein
VTATPLNACLPADSKSARLLAAIQDLAIGTEPDFQVIVRDSAQLPTLSSAAQVQQILSGTVCSRAAAAYDSVQYVQNGLAKNANRHVYLYQYGNLYMVADPTVKGGEYMPFIVFTSSFSFVSGLGL